MLYKTKIVIVEASQLTAENAINGQSGGAGDWLVIDEHGVAKLVTDVGFREHYEPADEEDVPSRFHLDRISGRPLRKRRADAGKPRAQLPVIEDVSSVTAE